MSTRRKPEGERITINDNGVELTVQCNARADLYSTFRVGGNADYLVRAGTEAEARLALAWAAEQGLPVTVFGGGSNLLVSDAGVRGLVVIARRTGRDTEGTLEVLDESSDSIVVRAPAFAPLTWLGRQAAERGWAGLSWAVGLPGNVGGAVVNNAGAHGTEMKDALLSLRVIGADGAVAEHTRAWLEPEYRRTRLKAHGNPRSEVVVDVTLRLTLGYQTQLRREADDHADYRHATQPTGACAGSIFKNPEGTYSGLIIEQLGLKGLRVGGAVVSDKHANFIVNDGGATAQQIAELIELVQLRVREETGIELSPEVERIGAW
jgi:UDP-N-acetylmuramate dehydrogenase